VTPFRGSVRRWPAVPLALTLAGSLAGCTGGSEPKPPAAVPAPVAAQTPPFADCAALAAPGPSAPPGRAAGADLPALELSCFTGGQPVRLTDLRGPAVINLWASWCRPCREELPAMQRLADETAGRLTVLGVNTGDDRDSAASFAADKQVTMPTLYDRDKRLASALGRVALPVTIFLDAAGKRHVETLPLDEARLADAVRTHTGVAVTR
jgi:cytochrome c biogenesis protein CcmG, thiol:disulfide interchange protein DsbE